MTGEQSETRVYREFAKIFIQKVVRFVVLAVLGIFVSGVFVGVMWLFTEAADYIIHTTAIDDNRISHMLVIVALLSVFGVTLWELGEAWTEAKKRGGQND